MEWMPLVFVREVEHMRFNVSFQTNGGVRGQGGEGIEDRRLRIEDLRIELDRTLKL